MFRLCPCVQESGDVVSGLSGDNVAPLQLQNGIPTLAVLITVAVSMYDSLVGEFSCIKSIHFLAVGHTEIPKKNIDRTDDNPWLLLPPIIPVSTDAHQAVKFEINQRMPRQNNYLY